MSEIQQPAHDQQKEGQRLILMDGTTIEDGRCGYAEAHLWCWVPGYTMMQAAMTFLDNSKTGAIAYEYGEMQDEYTGFTSCISITQDKNEIAVCLMREG